MPIEKTNQVRMCSFCEDLAESIFWVEHSHEDGKHRFMCAKCHYLINVQMGNVSNGAIHCFKCNTYSSFKAVYTFGTVHFVYGAEDAKGVPIYVPTQVTGSWRRTSVPNTLHCGSCSANIPPAFIYFNAWTTPNVVR